MMARRILITGLSSQVGGRLAQVLERRERVEAIVGVDTREPRHELQRTEFVRVQNDASLLRRIILAASIDTVVDTRLVADALEAPLSRTHEIDVVETANVLAACDDHDSPVRKLIFKSSEQFYGYSRAHPAFLSEEVSGADANRTAIEREVAEGEALVRQFAGRSRYKTVSILRLAEVIGDRVRGSHLALLNLPVIPCILGFDPRCQYVHEDDVVGALAHAAVNDLPGIYNVAADGVLALSEVASLLGKPLLPVLPPWGTTFAASQLRRIGLRVPVETIRQLRYGRGLDNRRLKAAGYSYRYTSREAVLKLQAEQRLRPLLRSGSESYRYEREVEEFLRRSPSVRSAGASASPASASTAQEPAQPEGARGPSDGYDELSAAEVIELIPSLEFEALRQLRGYEASHRAREAVLAALDHRLGRWR